MKDNNLHIGVDVDETLADHMTLFLSFLNREFKTDHKLEDLKNIRVRHHFGLSPDETLVLYERFVEEGYYPKMKAIEGSVEALGELFQSGHKISIISARPAHLEDLTREWLKTHHKDIDFDIYLLGASYVRRLRRKIDLAYEIDIDLMIEDSPHEALELAQGGVDVYLLDYHWNREIEHPKIIRVQNWADLLSRLE